MMELNIKGEVYQFNFGMGFLREINKMYQKPFDGVPDAKENVGFRLSLAGLYGKDPEILVKILDAANKGFKPRVTRELLDAHIDDEDTNINELFDEVFAFLEKANATKNVVKMFNEAVAAEEAKQKAKAAADN